MFNKIINHYDPLLPYTEAELKERVFKAFDFTMKGGAWRGQRLLEILFFKNIGVFFEECIKSERFLGWLNAQTPERRQDWINRNSTEFRVKIVTLQEVKYVLALLKEIDPGIKFLEENFSIFNYWRGMGLWLGAIKDKRQLPKEYNEQYYQNLKEEIFKELTKVYTGQEDPPEYLIGKTSTLEKIEAVMHREAFKGLKESFLSGVQNARRAVINKAKKAEAVAQREAEKARKAKERTEAEEREAKKKQRKHRKAARIKAEKTQGWIFPEFKKKKKK